MKGFGETHHRRMGFTLQSYGPRAHTFNLQVHNLQFLVTYCLSILILQLSVCGAEEEKLEYYIHEEARPHTDVGNIIQGLRLASKYSHDKLDQLRFKFLTRPSVDKDFFYIDAESSQIKTKFQIDRDAVCPKKDVCFANYDVAITPQAYFQIVKVQIEILDINDNQPQFPSRRVTHQISESAVSGTSFVIPPAYDPDSAENGIQRYGLFPESRKFAIQRRETADGATDLRLVLNGRLDREKNDFYELSVVAYDGGKPAKSGSISLDVYVIDANDNDPQFTNETYRVSVRENTPLGTTVIRVTAHDADEGANGEIEYEFSSNTEKEFGHLFGINPDTGEVFIRGDIDYEKGDIHLLSLTAKDRGPDSLPASATLVVHVQDVNDNAPEISVNIMTPDGTAQVAENAEVESFVTLISVSDADSDQNGQFNCNIDNNQFTLVPLSQSHFKLVTATMFDREFESEYEVTLTCRDHGIPARVSATTILVAIQDENDHEPDFLQDSYTAAIQENNDPGVAILSVSAKDDDWGPNGEVTYSLNEEARQFLHIDPYTGLITAHIIFDHEQIKDLQFLITAEDGGNPSKLKRVVARLEILDLNDERPKFLQENYSFGIYENQPPNTLVGNVTAADKDSPPFDTFSYHLHPNSGSALKRFKIDSSSGRLYTSMELDRESQELYYLVVMAKPKDDPHFTSTATVTVRVQDMNDNRPVFTFPVQGNNTTPVSSHSPLGYIVARIRAYDKDDGENSRLSFFITEGNKDNAFSIDVNNGAISVNSDFRTIQKQDYELKLLVQDNGHPQYEVHSSLRLTVRGDIAFRYEQTDSLLSEENLTIILVFALATVCVAIVIIIAIVVIVRKKSRTGDNKAEKEKQRMLSSVERDGNVDNLQGAGMTKLATPNTYSSLHDELDRTSRSPTLNQQGPQGDGKPKANGYLKVDLRMEGMAKQQQSGTQDSELPPPPSSWMTGGSTSPSPGGLGVHPTSGSVHSASSGETLLRPSSRDGSTPATGHVPSEERHSPLDKQMQQGPKPVVAFIRDQAETEPTESDSAGSGLSNSDSGRGHSSEDGEVTGPHRPHGPHHHAPHPPHAHHHGPAPGHHHPHQGMEEMTSLHPDLNLKHPRTDVGRRTRSPVLRHTASPPTQLPSNGGPAHRISMSPSCQLPANGGPHRDMLMRELCDSINKSPKLERAHYDSRSLDRKKIPQVRFATNRRHDNMNTLPSHKLYGPHDDFDLPMHTDRTSGGSGDYFMYDSVDSAV